MKYLFFDVETTGLPQNYKAHFSEVDNWPRVVQLSWVLTNDKAETLKESDNIIKVDFPIPASSTEIHGISNERAQKEGRLLKEVLDEFQSDNLQADYLIAHNLKFDLPVLQAELLRSELSPRFENKSFCTMLNSVDYCKLEGRYGYKWPRLEEIYKLCFSQNLENAHNALIDVRATARVFHKLKEEKVFNI